MLCGLSQKRYKETGILGDKTSHFKGIIMKSSIPRHPNNFGGENSGRGEWISVKNYKDLPGGENYPQWDNVTVLVGGIDERHEFLWNMATYRWDINFSWETGFDAKQKKTGKWLFWGKENQHIYKRAKSPGRCFRPRMLSVDEITHWHPVYRWIGGIKNE